MKINFLLLSRLFLIIVCTHSSMAMAQPITGTTTNSNQASQVVIPGYTPPGAAITPSAPIQPSGKLNTTTTVTTATTTTNAPTLSASLTTCKKGIFTLKQIDPRWIPITGTAETFIIDKLLDNKKCNVYVFPFSVGQPIPSQLMAIQRLGWQCSFSDTDLAKMVDVFSKLKANPKDNNAIQAYISLIGECQPTTTIPKI